MDERIGILIVGGLVALVVILICREIACWYWKINKTISLLESIDDKLKTLSVQMDPDVLKK